MAGRVMETGAALLVLAAMGCVAGDPGGRSPGEPGPGDSAGSADAGSEVVPDSEAWATAEWVLSLRAWREEREERLRSPDGYLGLSDLVWLQPGANTFGADPGCALVLADDDLPARMGVLRLVDGSVTLELDPGLGADARGRVAIDRPAVDSPAGADLLLSDGTLALSSDASGAPHEVTIGRRTFWLIDRAGQLGLRVRDPQSPVLREFAGTDWFAPDESWRIAARFVPHAEAVAVDVPNILGSAYDDVSPGVLHFERSGRAYQLHPTGADAASMSLIFGDATNGRSTYGGGRFLSVPAPDADGTVWLDFNRAYNPPCAFSPFTTCPLPPAGNRLALAVEAGERSPPGHDD